MCGGTCRASQLKLDVAAMSVSTAEFPLGPKLLNPETLNLTAPPQHRKFELVNE